MTTKKKLITILMDTENRQCLSLANTRLCIERGETFIYTNCTNFADFMYLDKGYEVIAQQKNKKGDDVYVVLSELLENNREYIEKFIRPAHNISKMLVGNAFQFLPATEETQALLVLRDAKDNERRELLSAMKAALNIIREQPAEEYIANVRAHKNGAIATALRDLKSAGMPSMLDPTIKRDEEG